LLGSWTWQNGCDRPDFTFEQSSVIFRFDVDGTAAQHRFLHVVYEPRIDRVIVVHLNEPHGLSGTRDPEDLDIRIADPANAIIPRKGKKQDLDIHLRKCASRAPTDLPGQPVENRQVVGGR
jgi:hypothetical protein